MISVYAINLMIFSQATNLVRSATLARTVRSAFRSASTVKASRCKTTPVAGARGVTVP